MKDAMYEEYDSIMKNDVSDVVPRPEDKSVVTSKWLIKLNMDLMEVLKNTRPGSLLVASLKRKEWTMTKYLHQLLDTHYPINNCSRCKSRMSLHDVMANLDKLHMCGLHFKNIFSLSDFSESYVNFCPLKKRNSMQ